MKMRLIDADKMKERIENPDYALYNSEMRAEWIEQCIANAPTIEDEPVRHGEWECRYDEEYDDYINCCSVCGEPDALSRSDYNYRGGKIRENDSNYCPACGAKMDGDDENEKRS